MVPESGARSGLLMTGHGKANCHVVADAHVGDLSSGRPGMHASSIALSGSGSASR